MSPRVIVNSLACFVVHFLEAIFLVIFHIILPSSCVRRWRFKLGVDFSQNSLVDVNCKVISAKFPFVFLFHFMLMEISYGRRDTSLIATLLIFNVSLASFKTRKSSHRRRERLEGLLLAGPAGLLIEEALRSSYTRQ